MASDIALQRKYASNVGFLTESGDIFTGIYLSPERDDAQGSRKLTYRDALDGIRQSFSLELSHEITSEEPDKFVWAFMPRIGVLYDMAKRDKPWAGKVKVALSLDIPLRRGLYYLVKHRVHCNKGIDIDGSYKCGMEYLGST